jgi:hypothetical protein
MRALQQPLEAHADRSARSPSPSWPALDDCLCPQETVRELKKKLCASGKKMPGVERQRLTTQPKAGEARGKVLEDGKQISEYELADGSVVLFKDLGPQVRGPEADRGHAKEIWPAAACRPPCPCLLVRPGDTTCLPHSKVTPSHLLPLPMLC